MYSGDNAMPATTSVRRLPFSWAVRRAPGFRPCAIANASETQASMLPSPCVAAAAPASSGRPLRTVTRFMRCGWRQSTPISWPTIGSLVPSSSTRTTISTVVCTSATPGNSRNACATVSGARLTVANTSAKRPWA